MKNKIFFFILIFSLLQKSILRADAIITFFMRPYPKINEKIQQEKMASDLKKPGKIAKYTTHGLLEFPIEAGIFSTYAGYLTTSDVNGQTTFPRKHEQPSLYLLITQKITPIIMMRNTIHHWELEEKTPAAMFKIDKKQDEKTGNYFWDVQHAKLPENNRIPLESITIIAKPKNIFVPTGITLTNDDPQLILPNIYIKKGIMKISNALYILNLRNFFGTVKTEYKKESNRYSVTYS